MSYLSTLLLLFMLVAPVAQGGIYSTTPSNRDREGDTPIGKKSKRLLVLNPSEDSKTTLSPPEDSTSPDLSAAEVHRKIQDPHTSIQEATSLMEGLFLLRYKFQDHNESLLVGEWIGSLSRPDAVELFAHLIQQNLISEKEKKANTETLDLIKPIHTTLELYQEKLKMRLSSEDKQQVTTHIAEKKQELEKLRTSEFRKSFAKSVVLDQTLTALKEYQNKEVIKKIWDTLLESNDPNVRAFLKHHPDQYPGTFNPVKKSKGPRPLSCFQKRGPHPKVPDFLVKVIHAIQDKF